MDEQITKALDDLRVKMEGKNEKAIEAAQKAFLADLKEKFGIMTKEEAAAAEKKAKDQEDAIAQLTKDVKAAQEHADALDMRLKRAREMGEAKGMVDVFADEFKAALGQGGAS